MTKKHFLEKLYIQINLLSKLDIKSKCRDNKHIEYRSLFYQIIHEIYNIRHNSGNREDKKEISQEDVAAFIGFDRSTISISLTNFPIYLGNSKFNLINAYTFLKQKYISSIPISIHELQNRAMYLSRELNKVMNKLDSYYRNV